LRQIGDSLSVQPAPVLRSSTNRRRHRRRSTCLDAYVEFGGAQLPCVVVDVSAGGSQILVCFPELVDIRYANLVIEAFGSFACRVAWRGDTRAGLTFLHEPDETERRLRELLDLA
jgi:hypothetical protein